MSQNSENYSAYDKTAELLDFIDEQFDIPQKIFGDCKFFTLENTNIVYLCNSEILPLKNLRQIGLAIYKGDFPRGYLTNAFVYRFGRYARKNVIEVKKDRLEALINREGINLPAGDYEKGHWIVKSDHRILGRGWVREGQLYLDVPKIWRQNIKFPAG